MIHHLFQFYTKSSSDQPLVLKVKLVFNASPWTGDIWMCPADGAASTTNAGDLCRKIFGETTHWCRWRSNQVHSYFPYLVLRNSKHTFDLFKVSMFFPWQISVLFYKCTLEKPCHLHLVMVMPSSAASAKLCALVPAVKLCEFSAPSRIIGISWHGPRLINIWGPHVTTHRCSLLRV